MVALRSLGDRDDDPQGNRASCALAPVTGVCHLQGPGCCLSPRFCALLDSDWRRREVVLLLSQTDGGAPLTIVLRRPGLSTALVRDGLAAGRCQWLTPVCAACS